MSLRLIEALPPIRISSNENMHASGSPRFSSNPNRLIPIQPLYIYVSNSYFLPDLNACGHKEGVTT